MNTQASQTEVTYHYVLTLSTEVRTLTQGGVFTIPMGEGITRQQAFEKAMADTRAANGLAPDAQVTVVFWSLEPNAL
ncbi:hypothetical protein [Halostreptopolyspora alba]|uniref:Uncharacterized protein n=1 Tax=Halostreptopolyspora alba TaxID=2487137 RepID=A0A3N0E748_9ACTN|nr:hypothetical protein EFW17_15030 [Nocardiopsaceae bacterium YIM 96095]